MKQVVMKGKLPLLSCKNDSLSHCFSVQLKINVNARESYFKWYRINRCVFTMHTI